MHTFKHDDLTGEIVAKMWHHVAQVISIAAAISGLGIVITATAGAVWHNWATKQHQIEINRLSGEKHNELGQDKKS